MDRLRLAITGLPPDAGHGWQVEIYVNDVEMTPDRTAGRLVLESVDPARLPDGIELHWVAPDWSDPRRMQVSLMDRGRQVILGFDWADRTPAELAAEIRHTLHEVPRRDWRG